MTDVQRYLDKFSLSGSINVIFPSGYWKVSSEATTPLQCPLTKSSCLGGNDFGYLGNVSSSCFYGYTGPLCSTCGPDRFIDWTERTCENCTFGSVLSRFLLFAPLGLLLPLWICATVGRVPSIQKVLILHKFFYSVADVLMKRCH